MSYIVPEIKQWLPNASAPVRVATTLEVVNGNGQSARVDQRLANPLVVRVKDQNGAAMSGVSVSFSVTPGGTVSPSSATTGSNGEAETRLTLGGPPGTYTVTARASGITQSVTFTATATAPAPLAFSPNTIAAQTFYCRQCYPTAPIAHSHGWHRPLYLQPVPNTGGTLV